MATNNRIQVNANANLTADMRKTLLMVIERAFTNKENLYAQMAKREKGKIIEAYKKEVGYEALHKKYKDIKSKIDKLQQELLVATKAIQDSGLDVSGFPASTSNYENGRYVTNYKAVKLQKLLQAVEDNAPSRTMKDKFISRMCLATKVGEANNIIREILGNDIIEEVPLTAIDYKG